MDLRSTGHNVTTLDKLFARVPLLPSSVIWYRPKGCDALWLGR